MDVVRPYSVFVLCRLFASFIAYFLFFRPVLEEEKSNNGIYTLLKGSSLITNF